jgi:thiol-disulfide isomerase/thioredoxin
MFLGKSVLLFFSASWCKNCMKIKPFMMQMAEKYKEELVVIYVDTTDDKLQEVAMTYGVTALPRILSYQQGTKINDYLGSNTTEIEEMISSLQYYRD